MAVSAAQKIAVKKYRNKTYDTIGFDVPKGKREEFKAKASGLGLSLAKFLLVSAESYGGESLTTQVITSQPSTQEKLTPAQKQLVDEFSRLPVDAQKQLIKFLRSVNENTTPNMPE